MGAHIIGWSHTKFGRHAHKSLEDLIVEVVNGALEHAQVSAADVDQVFLGHFNAGFSRQDFTSALTLQADPKLRFAPCTRVENACASGSAAVFQGVQSIKAGQARITLVIGAEKMTDASNTEVAQNLLRAAYVAEEGGIAGGFAGVFGKIADCYFYAYGDQSDALARIAAKNHLNGVSNPFAHMQKDLGFDFCREESDKNPFVAGPLKRTDCSLVSDGAAALVIVNDDVVSGAERAISFRGMAHVQDYLPLSRRDILRLEGCTKAWGTSLSEARLTLDDLSFVESHDCFTIAELLEYEAMGLTGWGEGQRAIAEGWTLMGGRLPVNPSGGLKAKGHPIGATGVSMHVMAAMQLSGTAPSGMQLENAEFGGIFNMGGAGVANYASVLQRRM